MDSIIEKLSGYIGNSTEFLTGQIGEAGLPSVGYNIVVIFAVVFIVLVVGFSLGRSRMLLALVSLYAAGFINEYFPFLEQVQTVYKRFGFDEIIIFLSDRPDNRVGTDEQWDKAEAALHQALQSKNIEYGENPGEGAFYGPKIEFQVKDALGRPWQLGTLQVDYSMPERFDLNYIQGQKN